MAELYSGQSQGQSYNDMVTSFAHRQMVVWLWSGHTVSDSRIPQRSTKCALTFSVGTPQDMPSNETSILS